MASLRLGLLFLNLHLDDVTWMLNNLRNESLMSPPYFSRESLCQVDKPAIHPIKIKNTGTGAVWLHVGRNHAPNAMQRPEHKEHNEEVVGIPEPLILGSSPLFDRRENDGH